MANYLTGDNSDEADKPLATAGDFAKTLGAGTAGIGSNLAAAYRYGFELGGADNAADIAQGIQKIFGAAQGGAEDSINPETRKLAASTFTSPEFWEHPVLATALKTTGMLPAVAALAIPGGLMADAVGATMMAAAGGAAINAGTGLDEFYKKLDAMSDEELQAQSPKYKAMREMFDEKSARAKFNKEAQGWGPGINAVIGAIAASTGAAGSAGRALAGGNAVAGAEGRLASGALGGLEGAAGNAVQAGASDVTSQNADIEAGLQKEFDRARTVNAAIEGGALGGLMGGAVGLVMGGGAHGQPEPPPLPKGAKPPPTPESKVTSDAPSPQPTATGVSTAAAPPPSDVKVGNPQNAPTQSGTGGAKATPATKASKSKPAPPPSLPLDTGIAAAVTTKQGGETPAPVAPTEHAAITEPTPNATIDQLNGKPPVTPEGNAAPVSPQLDTGANVPETKATIKEQIAQIGTGDRKAVMFPNGTVVPASAMRAGFKSAKTPRGRFIYDPKLTTAGEIQKLSRLGRENELLGLGPVSKPEAVARVQAGETPIAVTESTPGGTEVKAAAGTTATAPQQAASLEANKTPGNVVAVQAPEEVLAKRMLTGKEPPRTGRILPNLTQTGETVALRGESPESKAAAVRAEKVAAHEAERAKAIAEGKPEPAPLGEEPAPEPKGKGKNYRGEAGKLRDEKIAKAQKITDEHAPNVETERDYMKNPEARDQIIRRASAMLEEAKKVGLRIQAQLKKSEKGDAASDHPSIQILREAKDLEAVASKHKEGRARTEAAGKFAERERSIRGGFSDEVLADRREEGDARFKKNVSGEEVSAGAYQEEAPKSELEGGTPDVVDRKAVSKDDVVTSASQSAKMGVRGVEAPTEAREVRTKEGHVEKVETAKAASGEKLSPEAKKALIAEMNAKLLPPKKNMEKNKGEALRVERNPTEAQKVAGNYKKGHRRVEGLDFTIENPKGAIRRGRGEDGQPWEVRMPADYGYIRGTEGADGDHIDAYDLRHGDRHFVVDQLDHRTGEFDEHKVMLRAKDEHDAVDTYKRAFSDEHGADRLGNIHELTAKELHEWKNSGDTTEPITSHALNIDRNLDDVKFDSPVPVGEKENIHGDRFRPIESMSGAEAVKKLDLRGETGIGGTLGRFFQSRLAKLADHVDVHYVDRATMDRLFPDSPGAAGMHTRIGDSKSEVYIENSARNRPGLEFGSHAHVLLHELTHAVTVREIANVPGAHAAIQRMALYTHNYMKGNEVALRLEFGMDNRVTYGMTNAKEFIAEAFSNKNFQDMLSRIPISEADAAHFGLRSKSMSMWDVFRGYVKKIIEKTTGKLPQFDSVLDGIMKVGEHITKVHDVEYAEPFRKGRWAGRDAQERVNSEALNLTSQASERVKQFLEDPLNNTRESAPKALKLRTFDNIADLASHFFGESNPVRTIHEAIERMRVTGQRIAERGEPIIRQLATLRAANAGAFNEFSKLLHDATVANVHPDVSLSDTRNAHLGKNKVVGDAVWSKAQHPELARRYRELVSQNPQYADMWHDVVKHFTDTQNQMTLGIIKNQILKLMGIDDDALAQRIHEGDLTDADRTALGGNLDTIEKASELSKIEGPYVPLMRRGDHVVKADHDVTLPGNAKKISSNEFEFQSEKEATDYAKSNDLKTTIKKVWVDEKTGETTQVDPATGKEHRMSANDLDSVARYRAEVQNRHVEFVQGRRAAEARAAELAKDAAFSVHEVVPRAYEPGARQAAELSTALGNLVKKLEKSDSYKNSSPTQQAALRHAINEAALASHASTRVSSRALPRRGVKGYSEDLVQNTVDYGASSSRYLAKLEHAPALEEGLKDMQAQLDRDHSKTGQYARTAISNEVRQRVDGDNGFQQGGKLAPIVKRALSISFIDKLGSPAYSVINAMQPGMVTMPYLIGRHGVGRSFAAMAKAYSDISAVRIVKEGLKETGRRIAGSGKPEDFISSIVKKLSPDERRMIDEHLAIGTIDPSAGMEIANLVRDRSGVGGKIDTGLGYLEGVTREMPRAIEAINRAVTAIAAYRLERAKGATHEEATLYSKQAVNNTQFNYSPTNSPALFNHPLLKIALQFKKYGQGMYQLIGTQIANAIRNEKPGDRAQAVKTLITLAATHTAVAGALGLPTEPFKYLLMGAHAFGLTSLTWGDIEDKIRKEAASVFGKTGGEIFSRGLPRLANIDLSRAGLDSVTSFGEPKSAKESDVKSWLFDSLAGPVVSLGGDWIKGLNQITNGDFEKAAENLIPLKAASDTLRAYRQATEGKKSASGKSTMTPYTPYESSLRVLGFGSGREAEIGAKRGEFYRQSDRQKQERGDLVNTWASASNAAKAKAWVAIQQWNKQQPDDVKIQPKELTAKAKRDAKQAQQADQGIVANKRDKHFLAEGSIYNTR